MIKYNVLIEYHCYCVATEVLHYRPNTSLIKTSSDTGYFGLHKNIMFYTPHVYIFDLTTFIRQI